MDDNILMEQQSNIQLIDNGSMTVDNGFDGILWRLSHLIDFSDLSIGKYFFIISTARAM